MKLFGWFGSWRSDHRTERAVHELLATHPDIPAPRLLAHGQLYGEPDPWPYLVTPTNAAGRAGMVAQPPLGGSAASVTVACCSVPSRRYATVSRSPTAAA